MSPARPASARLFISTMSVSISLTSKSLCLLLVAKISFFIVQKYSFFADVSNFYKKRACRPPLFGPDGAAERHFWNGPKRPLQRIDNQHQHCPLYSICTVYVQYLDASEAYKYCTYTVHILYNWRRKWGRKPVFRPFFGVVLRGGEGCFGRCPSRGRAGGGEWFLCRRCQKNFAVSAEMRIFAFSDTISN